MAYFSIRVLSAVTLAAALYLTGCDQSPQYSYIEGETMGTSYHIRYRQPEVSEKKIKESVANRLEAINDSMSTYKNNATITKFNQLATNESIDIDTDFIVVFDQAKSVYKLSKGAFDPTVLPLVELWGFGSKMRVDRLQNPPSQAQIEQAKVLVDFDSIELEGNTLTKTKAGVGLDFSAIAKGYAVDAIAEVLAKRYHINNYIVEIGGEVATAGVNSKGKPWAIAIDAPLIDSSVSQRDIITVIHQPTSPINKLHLATSGNYRNSIVLDNVRYSHTIDPLTGSPIVGGAASVSVVSDTVALADAWATALTAMPYQRAFDMAQANDIAALFIINKPKMAALQNGNLPQNESAATGYTQADNEWQMIESSALQTLRAPH